MGGSRESETEIVWEMRAIPDLCFAGDLLRNHNEELTSELSHLEKRNLGYLSSDSCPLSVAGSSKEHSIRCCPLTYMPWDTGEYNLRQRRGTLQLVAEMESCQCAHLSSS